MLTLFLCGVAAFCAFKFYLTFKPYFDLQQKTRHCDWAAFRLIGCDAYNIYDKFQKVLKGHGSFWLGDYLSVIIDDPDDLKTVLNSEETFEKSLHYRFFFKHGLFVDSGEHYKIQRKTLAPMFHPTNLRINMKITNERMNEFFDRYHSKIDGNRLDARDITFKFTTRTVIQTLFDVKKEFSDHDIDAMRHDAEKFTCLASSRIFKPWLSKEFIFKHTSLATEIRRLKEKIFLKDLGCNFEELFKEEPTNLQSFFGLMRKIPMPYEEFLEATIFFMGASAETTSSSLSNMLHLLAMNPDAQNKLYEELRSVLKSSTDNVAEEEMSKMPYLDLVIKECLRLLPVAVIQGRAVTKPLKLKNYTLPAGTVAHIPSLQAHTDENLWGPDVLEFKPERFEEENFKKIHPYAYIPFSNGQRICPGMKYALLTMKIFLSKFLMRYKVSTDLKYKDLNFVMGLTLKTMQEPILLFESRE